MSSSLCATAAALDRSLTQLTLKSKTQRGLICRDPWDQMMEFLNLVLSYVRYASWAAICDFCEYLLAVLSSASFDWWTFAQQCHGSVYGSHAGCRFYGRWQLHEPMELSLALHLKNSPGLCFQAFVHGRSDSNEFLFILSGFMPRFRVLKNCFAFWLTTMVLWSSLMEASPVVHLAGILLMPLTPGFARCLPFCATVAAWSSIALHCFQIRLLLRHLWASWFGPSRYQRRADQQICCSF